MEITTLIFKKKDEDEKTYILDKILDKTGMKGTGGQRGCQLATCSVIHRGEGTKVAAIAKLMSTSGMGMQQVFLVCGTMHMPECMRQGHTSCSNIVSRRCAQVGTVCLGLHMSRGPCMS